MQRNYKAAPRTPKLSNKNFSASFYIAPTTGGGGDDVSVVSDTTGEGLCDNAL